jgi:hypothetical protein
MGKGFSVRTTRKRERAGSEGGMALCFRVCGLKRAVELAARRRAVNCVFPRIYCTVLCCTEYIPIVLVVIGTCLEMRDMRAWYGVMTWRNALLPRGDRIIRQQLDCCMVRKAASSHSHGRKRSPPRSPVHHHHHYQATTSPQHGARQRDGQTEKESARANLAQARF